MDTSDPLIPALAKLETVEARRALIIQQRPRTGGATLQAYLHLANPEAAKRKPARKTLEARKLSRDALVVSALATAPPAPPDWLAPLARKPR